MISRRILRTKIIQTVYSHRQSDNAELLTSEKELLFSVQKSYDLYFFLLETAVDVCNYSENRIDKALHKLRPTKEDLNPNLKFVNNKLIAQLKENKDLNQHLSQSKLSWIKYPELIKRLFGDLTAGKPYKEYMASKTSSYEEDRKILIYFFEQIVCECDLLYQCLEEQSIYWIDSVEFIISMVIRSLNKFKIGFDNTFPLLPMYKSAEDKDFTIRLFRRTIVHGNEYKELVSECAKNWDADRIAFIDMIILETATAEIIEFPEIPLRVTFNEYIEIAKHYSTAKSCIFINGVLDKIVQKLKADKKITKIAEMPLNIEKEEDTQE